MTHISDIIAINGLNKEQLEKVNKYHNHPSKEEKYQAVRDACTNLMAIILDTCPDCADKVQAINTVRLVRMWANSAIALEETKE